MNTSLASLTRRELDILAGVLLATGYVNIGSVNITKKQLIFDLRGPLFWRLSSGIMPLLHHPGSDFYIQLEAYMALLLLTGNAHVEGMTVAASALILRVRSPMFEWKRLAEGQRLQTPDISKAVLGLLNFAIGIQLIGDRLPFVITAVAFPSTKEIRFVTTAHTVQRIERKLPSKFTIPQQTNVCRVLNKVIGMMLTLQLLRIETVSMGRGGELAFSIGGRVFRFRKLLTCEKRDKPSDPEVDVDV